MQSQKYNIIALSSVNKGAVILLLILGLFLCPEMSGVVTPSVSCNGLHSPLVGARHWEVQPHSFVAFNYKLCKMSSTQNKVDSTNAIRQAQAIKERNQKRINDLLEAAGRGNYIETILDCYQQYHDSKSYSKTATLYRSNLLFEVRQLCAFIASLEEEVVNG